MRQHGVIGLAVESVQLQKARARVPPVYVPSLTLRAGIENRIDGRSCAQFE